MKKLRFLQCVAAMLWAVVGSASAQSFDYFLLAASWEPGFCVSHPGKPECSTLKGSNAGSNLVLHGLWPNAYDGNHPSYCGVDQSQISLDQNKAWCSMANYGVSSSTLGNLAYYMPGVTSCLDKHEWYKHGSCANSTPDNFWNTAITLTSRLNATGFNAFIRSNAGKYVTRSQLLSAFSSSFGNGSTAAVSLQCTKFNGISYFTETWINIKPSAVNQFPSYSSLVIDGNVQSTCPTKRIYIAAP